MQSYRTNTKVRDSVDKAVKDTEKEVTEAISALLTDAEQAGYGIPQVRDAIEQTQQ